MGTVLARRVRLDSRIPPALQYQGTGQADGLLLLLHFYGKLVLQRLRAGASAAPRHPP